MEFEELPNAVELAYTNTDKNTLDIPHQNAGHLIFLLRCVLENNYFAFDGKNYQKISKDVAVPLPEI